MSTEVSFFGSVPPDYVPTLANETSANINTQCSKMQDGEWIMTAKFRQGMYVADTLRHREYRFLKQHYKQMIPQLLQSHFEVFFSLVVLVIRVLLSFSLLSFWILLYIGGSFRASNFLRQKLTSSTRLTSRDASVIVWKIFHIGQINKFVFIQIK